MSKVEFARRVRARKRQVSVTSLQTLCEQVRHGQTHKKSDALTWKIVGAVGAGQSFSAIAHRYAITKGEVSRLVAKHRQTGSVKDHPRSGRPRVATDREDRMIAHHARQNRFKTARQIRDHSIDYWFLTPSQP